MTPVLAHLYRKSDFYPEIKLDFSTNRYSGSGFLYLILGTWYSKGFLQQSSRGVICTEGGGKPQSHIDLYQESGHLHLISRRGCVPQCGRRQDRPRGHAVTAPEAIETSGPINQHLSRLYQVFSTRCTRAVSECI